MEFSIQDLLISFAGGIFGAAIGAFPVWVLCGLAVLIGATLNFTIADGRFMEFVAWGFFLGPHTSFAGGTAAAAYAAKKGLLENGRDISSSLVGLNNPKVLLVGGIFGGLGYILYWLIMLIPDYSELPWTNTIALAVILNMVIVRFIFGKTGLFGTVKKEDSRWKATGDAGWISYQSSPGQLLLLGLGIAIPAAFFTQILPGSSGLVFGFVTFLLVFMLFGYKVPVTHHIALSASMVAATTGSVTWGIIFGLLAAYIGEYAAALFVSHADTHIDPPTLALVITFSLVSLLDVFSVFELPVVAVCLAGILVIAAIHSSLLYLQASKRLERVK
ncbi:hypothetical protein [uncultured Parabacteroides sp.]|jgi:hypothetical protein|uniref:hypothetical protein n=1 Tax=uncultured Parabacteroides sp. TaxID=512312 RepID=UPI0025FCE80A|nr:hypothetical protein [uncultured Parabacteroides sp.]